MISQNKETIVKAAKKAYKSAIFVFRRDMRLDDNTGLLYALKHADVVYPVFIFDKKQVDPSENKYYGSNCVQFMCESLADLERQIKGRGGHLNLLQGGYPDIIEDLLDATQTELVCINQDYTVYAKQRDSMIEAICHKRNVDFMSSADICLLGSEKVLEGFAGDVFFKKFTPYYNRAVNFKVRMTEECKDDNFAKDPIKLKDKIINDGGKQFYQENDKIAVRGGRDEALKILGEIHKMKNYDTIRNQPSLKTSMLSAYNKFGCVSIREVYYTAKTVLKEKAETFTRQLFWRDFYYYIAFYFPHVFKGPMKATYSMIPWEDDPIKIDAWQKGQTGCPIVDAAMRQMNITGWMPNRCRMIVSNYLIKDLHVNWQIGERYFANQLVDYDPSQNNGGWQWSSGSGVDSQPYFRIFNPRLQMEKFDANCDYIRKWCPELKNMTAKDIHNWETTYKVYKTTYPKPLVIHSEAKEKLIKMYKQSFNETADPTGGNSDGEYPKKSKPTIMKKAKDTEKSSKVKDKDQEAASDSESDEGWDSKKGNKGKGKTNKSKSPNTIDAGLGKRVKKNPPKK